MTEKKPLTCCICRGPILPEPGSNWAGGCNAEPVVPNGRCCKDCDNTVVIPMRIRRLMQARKVQG